MTLPILLFAAGKGTRMAPLTDTLPKPLITVAGKPLLDHAFDFATEAKCAPIVINTHYLGQMIQTHVAERDAIISDESDLLRETGGGLRHALPLLNSSPVATMNTDAVWRGPNPLITLLAGWRPEMECLLLLVEKSNVLGHPGAGDFQRSASGKLARGRDLIYTGVQITRTDRLSRMSEDVFSMNVVWDAMISDGGLHGVVYDGQWCDVGQPDSIPLAEAMCNV